ncbi:hypothetical protein [Cytobacillus purgationiresistens]|uniref:Membrane-bound ClpP family serine protease n=1 Tax=Cytobacillus purgationiresistens TaxID=863449 RepID=A0ABU0AHW1_9BACI|nr:hypothetical protein [Cytobacillus purgationiresistens]MDQ0270841.1 membrane-bound ClpP family serine protease [Cytobacillus purgationiresistens]
MELFGLPIETIYLYALIISGSLIILYLFFGDIVEGIGEAAGFLNPVLILAFITFMSAAGFILEYLTSINSLIIALIAAGIALLLDILLNVFVLIPMSSAEESLAYTEDSLRGRVGLVILPIPRDGFGEVLIESYSGRISKTAASIDNNEIEEGQKVLVVETKSGAVIVMKHENL